MKKSLFFTLAAASLLISCSDELITNVETSSQNGVNGKLVKAGLLSASRVNEEATRGYSALGTFQWMPEVDNDLTSPTAGYVTKGYLQLGLCWTGVNNADPSLGARTAANENVYTNYLFEHVGWLDKDADVPEVEECSDNFIDNGAFINGFTIPGYSSLPYADMWDWTGVSHPERWSVYYHIVDGTVKVTYGTYDSGSKDLNLGSGLFYTQNSTVFEGEYLVYFPYTSAFTKGQILAWEPKTYNYDQKYDIYQNLDKYTFSLGRMAQYEGGQQGASFRMANLAGYANVRLTNSNSATMPTGDFEIKEVILYSKSGGIIYEQEVDAAKAVAACQAGALTKNVLSTTDKLQKSNTIFATLENTAATPATEYATIADGETEKIILPVLPQIVDDLELILVNSAGKSYRKFLGSTEFKSNEAVNIDVTLDASGVVFDNNYYVVDQNTFCNAWNNINANGTGRMYVLNDIELTDGCAHSGVHTFGQNINIDSECANGVSITFKAGTTADATHSIYATTADKTLTFTNKVDLVVEGKGCCGNYKAILNLGKDKKETIKVNGVLTNHGEVNVKSENGTLVVADFENAYDQWAIAKDKYAGCALVTFQKADTKLNATIATFNNNGGNVKIAPTVPTSPASRTMTLNIDNLTNTGMLKKGVTVATATTDIVGGNIEVGQCALVNVKNLSNVNEWSNLKVGINSGYSTIEGRVDISGTSVNEGTIDNGGVMNFDKSLDNNGIFIDQQNAQVGISRVDCATAPLANNDNITRYYQGIHKTENQYVTDRATEGIYVARVNTVGRMAFVLADAVVSKSAQVVEITGLAGATTFNVAEYAQDLQKYDVRVDDVNEVTFTSHKNIASVDTNVAGYFANCLDVIKSKVILKNGLLKAKNVTLEKNAKLDAQGGTLATASTVTIDIDLTLEESAQADFANTSSVTVGNNVTIGKSAKLNAKSNVTNVNINNNLIVKTNGTADFDNKTLTVGNLAEIAGKFDSSNATAYTIKTVDVKSTGTFDSNGGANTVTGNFTTAGTTSFAALTSTLIKGDFAATAGTFEREELAGNAGSRATVNVEGSVSHTGATTTTAWPTKVNF